MKQCDTMLGVCRVIATLPFQLKWSLLRGSMILHTPKMGEQQILFLKANLKHFTPLPEGKLSTGPLTHQPIPTQ